MTTLSDRGQVQLIVPVDRGTRRAIRDAAVAMQKGALVARAIDAYLGKAYGRTATRSLFTGHGETK